MIKILMKKDEKFIEKYKNRVKTESENLITKKKNGLIIKDVFFNKSELIINYILPKYIHSYGYSYEYGPSYLFYLGLQ